MKQDYYDQILLETARKDAHYQTLLLQCRAAELEYRDIFQGLSPRQQQALERYIDLSAELGHRMVQLALELPRE